jgi:hypothetical protein
MIDQKELEQLIPEETLRVTVGAFLTPGTPKTGVEFGMAVVEARREIQRLKEEVIRLFDLNADAMILIREKNELIDEMGDLIVNHPDLTERAKEEAKRSHSWTQDTAREL